MAAEGKATQFIEKALSTKPPIVKLEGEFQKIIKEINPNGQQIGAIRDTIFAKAKEVAKTHDINDVLDNAQFLVRTLEITTLEPAKKVRKALFFPDDKTSFDKFYKQLESAKSTLDICVFTITDDRIANIIMKAHSKGVKVRVITDDEKANDLGADITKLQKAGIPVRIDNSPHHMHHKFAIVDKFVLINGSFNWTKSASTNNQENVTIIDDAKLIQLYGAEFERLWNKFELRKP